MKGKVLLKLNIQQNICLKMLLGRMKTDKILEQKFKFQIYPCVVCAPGNFVIQHYSGEATGEYFTSS